MKTKKVIKSASKNDEFLILEPPYTLSGHPTIPKSQSIIMKVGGLRKMIDGLDDEDSFRIEWFNEKETEYSFIKNKKD